MLTNKAVPSSADWNVKMENAFLTGWESQFVNVILVLTCRRTSQAVHCRVTCHAKMGDVSLTGWESPFVNVILVLTCRKTRHYVQQY